jgi:hypothetical protein
MAMSMRISQLYFFFGAFLIAGATFSMDDETTLEDVRMEIGAEKNVLTYKGDWPGTTQFAYNFCHEELNEQWQAHVKEHGDAMSDAQLNQLASRIVVQRAKKWALKGGLTLLWIGGNFGVFAGYDQIGVEFVEEALAAMTIAVDVNFVSWLMR